MLLNLSLDKKIVEIPIVQIRPGKTKVRKIFEQSKMKELAQSIGKNGLIHPIEVRKIGSDEYEVISGERRLRAAVMCGKRKIQCIVIDCDEKQAGIISLTENIQRRDLNIFEEAQSIERLMKEYGMTRQEVALRTGRNLADVINRIKLLKLEEEERAIMMKYMLTEYHAYALLRIEDPVMRRVALSEVIEKGMNVRQTEKYIEEILEGGFRKYERKQKNKLIIKNIEIFENSISKAIDLMQESGLDADAEKTEESGYIEYTIRIPKRRRIKEKKNTKTA